MAQTLHTQPDIVTESEDGRVHLIDVKLRRPRVGDVVQAGMAVEYFRQVYGVGAIEYFIYLFNGEKAMRVNLDILNMGGERLVDQLCATVAAHMNLPAYVGGADEL